MKKTYLALTYCILTIFTVCITGSNSYAGTIDSYYDKYLNEISYYDDVNLKVENFSGEPRCWISYKETPKVQTSITFTIQERKDLKSWQYRSTFKGYSANAHGTDGKLYEVVMVSPDGQKYPLDLVMHDRANMLVNTHEGSRWEFAPEYADFLFRKVTYVEGMSIEIYVTRGQKFTFKGSFYRDPGKDYKVKDIEFVGHCENPNL